MTPAVKDRGPFTMSSHACHNADTPADVRSAHPWLGAYILLGNACNRKTGIPALSALSPLTALGVVPGTGSSGGSSGSHSPYLPLPFGFGRGSSGEAMFNSARPRALSMIAGARPGLRLSWV